MIPLVYDILNKKLIDDCRLLYNCLIDFKETDKKIAYYSNEMTKISEIANKLIQENATATTNQNEYIKKYNNYTEKFNNLKLEFEKLNKEKEERKHKAEILSGFMFEIQELDALPIKFSEKLWNGTIDKVIVDRNENLTFVFKNGSEIIEKL